MQIGDLTIDPLAVAALSTRVHPGNRFRAFLSDRLAAARAIAA